MTKKNDRKFVLNEAQFNELVATPTLASAVFNVFKIQPNATMKEAFMFARLAAAQLHLEMSSPGSSHDDVSINLETGEILPKQPEGDTHPKDTKISSGVKRTVPA